MAELLGGTALGASKCPTLTAPRTPLDQYRPILPLVFVIKAIGKIAPRLRMSAFGAKRTLPLFDNAIPPGIVLCERLYPAGRDGGAGGIRTLDTALQPYNGLANRRLQPLGHSSPDHSDITCQAF